MGVVATVTVGASAGLALGDVFFWFDASIATPSLALAAGIAAAAYLARTLGTHMATRAVAVALTALSGLAPAVAALADADAATVARLAFVAAVVAITTMALSSNSPERTTILTSALPAGVAALSVAFAYSDIVDYSSDYGNAVRTAAWVFAAGSIMMSAVIASAYGVLLNGAAARRLGIPIALLALAYATPLAVSVWVSADETRRDSDALIQVALAAGVLLLVLGLTVPLHGMFNVLLANAFVDSLLPVTLLLMGAQYDRHAELYVFLLIVSLAIFVDIARRTIKRTKRLPQDLLPDVTPETFLRVAFPVAAGTAGSRTVGPVPHAAPDHESDVAIALAGGDVVVTKGDRCAALQLAASIAAGWAGNDTLVVWVSGETQDRIDTGLARGVEAVVQAGGARGPIYATVGAAMVAHRYFREFPGPVLVVVDGWSSAAAKRLDPQLWHGAASLLLVNGEWPGAQVFTVPETPALIRDDAELPDADSTLEVAILGGSPEISRRAMALLCPESDVPSAIEAHVARGVMRASRDAAQVVVDEHTAERYLAAWRDTGQLGARAIRLLDRVAHQLPEEGDYHKPGSAAVEVASAAIATWDSGREALTEAQLEAAARALHSVVEALQSACDEPRAHRLARALAERIKVAPGIDEAVRLRALVDAAVTIPGSSTPSTHVAHMEELLSSCRTTLGENRVVTLDVGFALLQATWQTRSSADVLDTSASLSHRFSSTLGPLASKSTRADRWRLNFRVLENALVNDLDAEVARIRALGAELPHPNFEVPVALGDLATGFRQNDRHDEADQISAQALDFLTEHYGDLHPMRAAMLHEQKNARPLRENPDLSLLRMIEIHPLLELALPNSAIALSAPMAWVEHYGLHQQYRQRRALMVAVGERMEQAFPPGSPVHDSYARALKWT